MSEFPATDIALEGFRTTREQPRAIGVWAAIFFVKSMVEWAGVNLIAGKELAAFRDALQAGRSMDELARRVEPLVPAGLLMAPLDIAVQAVLLAACYRAVLDPANGRRFYLGLGRDELRLLGVNLVLLSISFAVLLVARVVGEGVGAIAQGLGPVGPVILLLYAGAAIAAVVFLYVRLSLAPALTFRTSRVNLIGSWQLTRGRHWSLGGAYFMAFILAALVYVLGMVIASVLQAFGGGDTVNPLSPTFIVVTAWTSLIGVLISVIVQAPGAAAARHLQSLRS